MVDRAITLNSGLCVCVCGQPEGGGGWLRRQNCACDPIVCLCACVRSICVGLWIVCAASVTRCARFCVGGRSLSARRASNKSVCKKTRPNNITFTATSDRSYARITDDRQTKRYSIHVPLF